MSSNLQLLLNKNSDKKLEKTYGSVMSMKEFIECCEDGGFIDYDGFASEILSNGYIVNDEMIYPSDALYYRKRLLELDAEFGGLEIVWYNR